MGQCSFSKAEKVHDYILFHSGWLLPEGAGQSVQHTLNVGLTVLRFNKLRSYLANY